MESGPSVAVVVILVVVVVILVVVVVILVVVAVMVAPLRPLIRLNARSLATTKSAA